MKISDKEIKAITKGALLIEQEDGVLAFRRMFKEVSSKYNTLFKIRALASSGVRFDFTSGTEYLKIGYLLKTGSSQTKGAFDVWVDGRLYTSVGENVIDESPREIEVKFEKGEKHVTVYFPTLAQTYISSVEISEGAVITPFEDKPLALFFGDSITQGYTSELPSLNYVTRFCEMSGYDFYNFAVGGDVYNDFVTENVPERKPEIIFTAYGTNDWSGNATPGALKKSMRNFYTSLLEKYPSSRIVAILPIWRDCHIDSRGDTRTIGKFDDLFPLMRDILEEFPRVEIIDGRTLVPHANALYADLVLHPNDVGFEFYANSLYAEMSK